MIHQHISEIAIIVAGIDEEYQNSIIEGVIACAEAHNANISCFSAFGGVIANSKYDIGEYNIYSLINYENFDGVILMTNTISDPVEKEKIILKVKNSGLPVVVFDCDEYPQFHNISIDNTRAMQEIVRHVIKVHNAKRINYISGPLANPEAEDRYNAFIEVMRENAVEPEEKRIFFGEFRAVDGIRAVDAFLSSDLPMPDAIICANDAMALAAVGELEKHGYDVPNNVIVTGFDNTYNARHYCPALTTVARPLKEAGYNACDMMLRLINGEECENTIALAAAPIFSESCNCCNSIDEDIRSYKKGAFKLIESCRPDISLLNRMTTALAETEDIRQNMDVIGKFIQETGCERCCICLCSEWDNAFNDKWMNENNEEEYRIHGYTKNMSAPLIWDKGSISSIESFKSEDMFPIPVQGGGNISYFLPLHFRERCLGYYIITNCAFPIKSLLCHSLMMNISNSIENVRKLLHLNSVIQELDKLYVIDPLCGIYNRNGFIRTADNIFKKCQKEGSSILVSFIDMDGLKLINDNYGHKEGDFAIQRLASVINDCCKSGMICARFGGDEFIILGGDAAEEDIAPLEKVFFKHLESVNKIINKPYEIAASIGTIVTHIEPGTKLFTLITRADQLMYEQKKRKKTSRYLRR